MHVLVTGGAGFIGSHLVERLLDEDHRVTIIDNLDPFYDSSVKCRNLSRVKDHPQFTWLETDIRESDCAENVSGEIDAIVHIAARAGVRPSIEDPLGYYQTNVQGTLHMLEFARRRSIGQFIFASSSSVYGVNPKVPWTESDEGLQPISPYAATKLSCEGLGHVYSRLHGIRFIGLPFSPFMDLANVQTWLYTSLLERYLLGNPFPFSVTVQHVGIILLSVILWMVSLQQ